MRGWGEEGGRCVCVWGGGGGNKELLESIFRDPERLMQTKRQWKEQALRTEGKDVGWPYYINNVSINRHTHNIKVGQWCQTESHEDRVGEAEVVGGDGGGGWWWWLGGGGCLSMTIIRRYH